jgi:hypothetical protein
LIESIETRRTDYQIIKWPSTIQLVGVWLAQDSREEKRKNTRRMNKWDDPRRKLHVLKNSR